MKSNTQSDKPMEGWAPEVAKEYYKKYYRENIGTYRKTHQKLYLEHKDDPDYKTRIKETVLRYQSKNKEKILAHQAVMRAKRDKSLVQLPCLLCGEVKSMAHHPDYSKRLEVVWLCTQHHKEYHKVQKACDQIFNIQQAIAEEREEILETLKEIEETAQDEESVGWTEHCSCLRYAIDKVENPDADRLFTASLRNSDTKNEI